MNLLSCVSLDELILGFLFKGLGGLGILGISIVAFVVAGAIISRHPK